MRENEHLIDAANANFERIALDLLGNPTSRTRSELRFGARGSLSLDLNKLVFYDHETAEGGGIVALLSRELGSRQAAWRWLWASYSDGSAPMPIARRIAPPPAPKDEKHELAARKARRIWDAASPAPADHPYLIRKGIDPHGMRQANGALIVPVRTIDGALIGLQFINDEKRFLTGTQKSAPGLCFLGSIDAETIAIAEGFATAASVRQATGWTVAVAFDAGNLPKVAEAIRAKRPAARIVIAGDHDAKSHTGQLKAYETAGRVNGRAVIPPTPGDWNDYSQAHGLDSARAALIGLSLPEGQERIRSAIRRFLDRASDPETHSVIAGLITATVGLGKSYALIAELRRFIESTGKTVFLAAPEHNLAAELAATIRARGLDAAIWRGTERPDPDNPGHAMCLDLEAARVAHDAHIKLSEYCKICPLRDSCGYQAQRAKRANIWVGTHAMLLNDPPKAISDAGLIVIDEDPVSAALSRGNKLPLALLCAPVLGGMIGKDDREALAAMRAALKAAIDRAEGPYLDRDDLAGIGAADAAAAYALEWSLKPKVTLDQTDREASLAAMRDAASFNANLPLLWKLIEHFLQSDADACPWIRIAGPKAARVLTLDHMKPISSGWDAPKILLDATGRIERACTLIPDIELLASVTVDTPYQTIIRVDGRGFAKEWMVEKPGPSNEGQRTTARNNIKKLRWMIEVKASRYRRVGVIINKAAREALEAGLLPPNVTFGHFNALRGLNAMSDCDALLVIGRTKPDAEKSNRQAHIMAGTLDCPDLEKAVAWSICEAELLQAVGRARGVQRGPDNPVTVYLLNSIPLELPISETVAWDDFQPTPLDLLAARGVVIEADSDAKGYWPLVAAMLPDRFDNEELAKKHKKAHPALWGKTPIENVYIGVFPRKEWHLAETKAGERGWIPVRVDPDRIEALQAVIQLRNVRPAAAPPERPRLAEQPRASAPPMPPREKMFAAPVPLGLSIGNAAFYEVKAFNAEAIQWNWQVMPYRREIIPADAHAP